MGIWGIVKNIQEFSKIFENKEKKFASGACRLLLLTIGLLLALPTSVLELLMNVPWLVRAQAGFLSGAC